MKKAQQARTRRGGETPPASKRILLLSHEDPSAATGGLGIVVGELEREFEILGAEVQLVTAVPSAGPAARAEPALDPYALPRPEDRADTLASFRARALASARDLRPDVIHAHDWVAIDAGLRLRETLGTRLVAHVHSTEWDRSLGRVDPWILAREGAGLRAAERVLCVSERTRESVCRGHGVPRSKTAVVYPGLPLDCLRARHGTAATGSPQTVLFLGRLVPQKGLDLFLRTALRVLESQPAARFVVAGDGPLFGLGLEHALELGLGRAVRFGGHLTRPDLFGLLGRGHALCLPSLAEPFGLVALEAAQAGVPVVVSERAGCTEAMTPFATFAPLDVEAAARGVLAALGEPERVATWRRDVARDLTALAPRVRAAHTLAEVLGKNTVQTRDPASLGHLAPHFAPHQAARRALRSNPHWAPQP